MSPTFYTDPSITGRGLQQPDLLSTYMRLMQIQQMRDERRRALMQEEEGNLRLAELRRITQEERAKRAAMAAGVERPPQISNEIPSQGPLGTPGATIPFMSNPPAPRTTFNPQAALAEIAKTAPEQFAGMQGQFASQQMTQQEQQLKMAKELESLTGEQLKNGKARLEIMGSLAHSVKINPGSYPSAKAMAEKLGVVQPGQLPEQFTPEMLPQLDAWESQAMNLKDAMTMEETRRHNLASEQRKPVPGVDLPLSPEVEAQKKRIAQAGRQLGMEDETVEVYAKNLSAGRINTTDVPIRLRGKVLAAVEKEGNIVVPKPVRQTLEQMDKAEGIIDIIETNYNALERSAGPGALAGGTLDFVLAKLQANPDAQMLRTQIGLLGNLARSISAERGVLTDRDVNRAMELLPQLTDRADVAKRKVQQLRGFIQNARRAATGSMNKVYPAGGGAARSATQGQPQIAEPPRPANVPADYVFMENGPKGRGWYKPQK